MEQEAAGVPADEEAARDRVQWWESCPAGQLPMNIIEFILEALIP